MNLHWFVGLQIECPLSFHYYTLPELAAFAKVISGVLCYNWTEAGTEKTDRQAVGLLSAFNVVKLLIHVVRETTAHLLRDTLAEASTME